MKVLSPLLLAALMMFSTPVFHALSAGKGLHHPHFQPQHETVIFKTPHVPGTEFGSLTIGSESFG